MFLRYTPSAGEEELFEFRPEKTPFNRAVIAEKLYSKLVGERRTWEQLVADAQQGGIGARKVALWVAQTATHPLLRFDDLPEVEVGQLGMEYSKEELRRMRDGIAKSDALLDSEKNAMLESLATAIQDAPAGSDEPVPAPDPEIKELDEGKGETTEALSSSETSTG